MGRQEMSVKLPGNFPALAAAPACVLILILPASPADSSGRLVRSGVHVPAPEARLLRFS
jgi:hypothetical protein